MPAVFTIVISGGNVSSAFTLPDATLSLAVQVPSHAATWGNIQVQFAPSSAGPFGPFWIAGMNSATIFTGAGPGYGEVPRPPSTTARILVTNSTASVASFTILSVRH